MNTRLQPDGGYNHRQRRDGPLRQHILAVSVSTCLAASASAQSPQFETWMDAGAPKSPARRCASLRALSGFDFSVDVAESVAATKDAPAFCRVTGLVQPEIRFEVSLPQTWNGRLYMFGNGGFAGESLAAGFRAARRNLAVGKGFVAAQTNTGHDASREPLASFASNPQKLSDYAYRAVHVTAVTAKALARAFYGSGPAYSYFDGCSTGGRQGLISAQRFPDDFDGIVVGAPVLDFTGTMMHYTQVHQALARTPLDAAKVRVLAEASYRKCDAVDGVTDGIIADPRACAFDPATDIPRCRAGSLESACLTDVEIASVAAVLSPLSIDGKRRFPGFPVGPEGLAPGQGGTRSGWDPWIVRSGEPTVSFSFMESFFRHMATPGRELDWRTFDPARDSGKLGAISALLDATDTDLSAFRGRKGRILMWYGWADPALSPLMGLEYYERVVKTMGAGTSEFFRLFMMPGVFHCSGGVGPDRVDTITPLVNWVERGIAPAMLIASQRAGDVTTRTRPLCPHPQVARYTGRGSPDAAENFTCVPPVPD